MLFMMLERHMLIRFCRHHIYMFAEPTTYAEYDDAWFSRRTHIDYYVRCRCLPRLADLRCH